MVLDVCQFRYDILPPRKRILGRVGGYIKFNRDLENIVDMFFTIHLSTM